MARKGIRGLYKRGRIWWMCYGVEKSTVDSITGETITETRILRESTHKTKQSDAIEVLDAMRQSIRTGHYIPEDKRVPIVPHPWEIECDAYLADRVLRHKRADSYRKLADWREAFAGRDLGRVTLEDVEAKLAEWKDARQWSGATYNNALAAVSGLFSYAYRKGWIERHPLKGRAERMQGAHGRERYFYPHEIAAMRRTALAVARRHGHPRTWLSDAILGAAITGLRRGNFCELTCGDVREDERGDLYLHVGREKNGEPIAKRVTGELREIVERRTKDRTPAALLFPGPDDGNAYTSIGRYLPVVVRHVGRHHKDWKLRWGMKGDGVTFHSFRHAMASLALNAGVPMDTVQQMGGWKTASQVRVYARRADQGIRDGEDKLAAILQMQPTPGVKQPSRAVDGRSVNAAR